MTIDELHNFYLQKLKCFAKICKNNGIEIFLAGGTLLGAIKYNDFIPWDDDVDLAIPRCQYDKLLAINPLFFKEQFIIENIRINKKFLFPYTKIVFPDLRSVLIKDDKYGYNEQIIPCFDIYPIDYVDDKKLKKVNFYKKIYEIKYCNLSVFKNIFKKVLAIFIKLIPGKTLIKTLDKTMKKAPIKHLLVTRWRGPIYNANTYNSQLVFPGKITSFKNIEVCIPNNSNAILENVYGNKYMFTEPKIDFATMRHSLKSNILQREFFDSLIKQNRRNK